MSKTKSQTVVLKTDGEQKKAILHDVGFKSLLQVMPYDANDNWIGKTSVKILTHKRTWLWKKIVNNN